jgi:putative DNA methylase
VSNKRLIETDTFPFEFLSTLGERESWRKEIHRPIYHVHKWWAKRLGSVFRGILLGCVSPEGEDLPSAFYRPHSLASISVLDPFMGSGTTIGEAHKLGMTAFGRDINPVAVGAARVGLTPLPVTELQSAFDELAEGVGRRIRQLYMVKDLEGHASEVLYFFWVMVCGCPKCERDLDLFPSYVIAANAYPKRKPQVQVLCPACGGIFSAHYGDHKVQCGLCGLGLDPRRGVVHGAKATCVSCREEFSVLNALGGRRPRFRLYAKLVLTSSGLKKYVPATESDIKAYEECGRTLRREETRGRIRLPSLTLAEGYNTQQAIGYGFRTWREFFNDRQLLALGWLRSAIMGLDSKEARGPLLTLFSGVLEFNNMFASYKGEGTGAVRHMFAHHILKPQRTPLEANVWGTPRSSGSFSTLFRSRLLRAAQYQKQPTEVTRAGGESITSSLAFASPVKSWPKGESPTPCAIYLSCGDSKKLGLPSQSVDLVVTDPPFFDNVHYSELADFFYSWQQIGLRVEGRTTRSPAEVQDASAREFGEKLGAVLAECSRVLKEEGLLVFTYHHSRDEGWKALSRALRAADFVAVNCHPVKSEMSVAAPKTQAKEPIQLDIILVCRKRTATYASPSIEEAFESGKDKIRRLEAIGLCLSRNDRKVVLYGQLMTIGGDGANLEALAELIEGDLVPRQVSEDGMHKEAPQLEML